MILLFEAICLFITMCVLRKYITTGTHSRTHRLLPLILGLIATYDFYEIVLTISGQEKIFFILKELLMIQMLYLLLFYALDFLRMKMPEPLETGSFILLLMMDAAVLLRYGYPELNRTWSGFFIVGYALLILGVATYAYIRYSFSKREHRVTNMVYLSFVMPAVALLLVWMKLVESETILLASLACTCLIMYYLVATEQLTDPLHILQEKQYNTADIAVVSFDSDCYYLGANQAARRLFTRELSVDARKSRPELYMDNIKSMAWNPDKAREIEYEGRNYRCQIAAVYYHDRLKGYNLSIIDITEQKNETRMMASLRNAAETRTELKSRFLATMSHDLRSPLHAIMGICDLLAAKREISARNRSLIYHIRSAGNALLTQVDAILEYSKLEAGRMEFARKNYNLGSMMEELAHTCVINLQSRPVRFSIVVLNDFPKTLIGDEMRVREIVLNLLSNAVKFTEQGEIRCEISLEREEADKRIKVCCCVTDSGAGMSREQMEQIFEEYVSFSAERSTEGAGLGLCIVKQLAERMGGFVTAESDGVSGSAISAVFYQEYAGDEMCPPISYTKESVLRQTASYRYHIRPTYVYPKARVLLADDMRINQEIFKELALPWRFAIDFAGSGREAVEAAKRQRYQLIFLDQMMPEMMGEDAAEMIRGFCDTPLIMMTANLEDDIASEYRQHGFCDFLAKPIELVRLQHILDCHMPKEYRCAPHFGSYADNVNEIGGSTQAYRRTLETFLREIRPLTEELPDYAERDLMLFRVKAHGIKSASRQIDRIALSESAEILEMAAKTQNLNFIQAHLQDFVQELLDAMEEVKEELQQLPVREETETEVAYSTEELFGMLKQGFDAYQLDLIEKSIQALERMALAEWEEELLEQAKAAYDELDYEMGSALFS